MDVRVTLPSPVSHDLRNRIRRSYEDAIENVDDLDAEYVLRKTVRVITRLASQGGWLRELARAAYALRRLAIESEMTIEGQNSQVARPIIAALFYLCDPWDVIPDYTSAEGYLDDSIVINRCMAMIKSSSPEMYIRLCELASSESVAELLNGLEG